MKPLAPRIFLSVALALGPFAITGCQTTATTQTPGTPARGPSAIVVEAERDLRIAFHVVDAFLEWEFNNRQLVSKDVQTLAANLRENFPAIYAGATAAVRGYKRTHAVADNDRLTTALAALNQTAVAAMRLLPSDQTAVAVDRARR